MERHRRARLGPIAVIALLGTLVAGCASNETSATPSPTGPPAATTFDEYAVAFCSAWEALFTAVGNPDTASGSVLSLALDEAVTAQDELAAELKAVEITAELESGRQHAAVAGGWPPASQAMAQMDRFFLAYEAMIAAKVARAAGRPDTVEPQAAFEGAGGLEAWMAFLEAYQAMHPDGPTSEPCDGLPIGP